jgi:5-methylcytosine-specific restriction endonuclease McrA
VKNHIDVYRQFWWDELTLGQTEQCAMCGEWGADIHHLKNRQAGGSKCRDTIENLICLCRSCHNRCHSDKEYNMKARVINLRNIADKLESEYL